MRGPVARVVGLALVAASAALAAPALAERFDDGLAAYKRNDFETSLKILQPLAEKGDVRAQYFLGRQHQFGQGTKVDRAEAYHWYRRAEAKGHLEAKLFRILLEKRWNLSPADKARGERKFVEATAAKPKLAQVGAKPKTPPRRVADAAARPPAKAAITSRPSFRTPQEEPKREIARREPAKPATAKPAVAEVRARPPERPPVTAPRDTARANPPQDETWREKEEPARTAAAREREEAADDEREPAYVPPARRDSVRRADPRPQDDHADADDRAAVPARPEDHASLPAETRTPMPPGEPDDEVSYRQPPHAPPSYPPPAYASVPSYPPPYYAPGAPPAWRPGPYYGPRVSYGVPWGYRPRGGYMHPGWRGAGWRGYPGRGFRHFR